MVSICLRYIPALRGVVLSHSNLRFLSKTGAVQGDCPFLVCPIEFDATIWSPRVGMKLSMFAAFCLYNRDLIPSSG